MKTRKIKVLIVDDHLMVRKGLSLFIESIKDMELVGEASNAASATKLFENEKPDVTLIDLVLPNISGVEIIRRIRASHADAVFIALTSFGEESLIKEALQAGARGFLYKDISVQELADAIRQTHKGRVVLASKASEVMVKMLNDLTPSTPQSSDSPALSEREKGVLKLLAQGLTNKQIASQLDLQSSTIKQYVSSILSKLKAKSRAGAIMEGIRLRLIDS